MFIYLKISSNFISYVCIFMGIFLKCSLIFICLCMLMGLSTLDLGSASDADRGSGFKDHTRPRSGFEQRVLCCVTVHEQCNARSLRAVWSSCTTTLSPDRGSVSSESVFCARVESPYVYGYNYFNWLINWSAIFKKSMFTFTQNAMTKPYSYFIFRY